MISSVLTLAFLTIALGTAAIVFCIRTAVEYGWKTAEQNTIWRDLVLPLLPIVVGLLCGITTSATWLTGLAAGLCSSAVYRAIKAALGAASN